jgi:hypothetical protein
VISNFGKYKFQKQSGFEPAHDEKNMSCFTFHHFDNYLLTNWIELGPIHLKLLLKKNTALF